MCERKNLSTRLLEAVRSIRLWPRARKARSGRVVGPESQSVLIVIEGNNDIEFLRRASTILSMSDRTLPNLGHLERSGRIVFVPSGGDVRRWAFRLAELRSPEFHLSGIIHQPLCVSILACFARAAIGICGTGHGQWRRPPFPHGPRAAGRCGDSAVKVLSKPQHLAQKGMTRRRSPAPASGSARRRPALRQHPTPHTFQQRFPQRSHRLGHIQQQPS